MHELSIAMSIVDVASQEALKAGGRVVAVHLRLGPLSGVVKTALLSAYDLATETTPLAGSKLIVEETPLTAWCPTCEREQQVASPQWLCCPVCQTPTPGVQSGRELEIVGLEVIDDAQDANIADTNDADATAAERRADTAAGLADADGPGSTAGAEAE